MKPFYLRIAIDAPLRRLFDYLPPAEVPAERFSPGQRLTVPFGRRRIVGLLIEVSETTELPPSRLKRAIAQLDTEPVFEPELLELLVWAADYYRHPIGEVLAAALPAPLRSGADLAATQLRWRLTTAGRESSSTALPARASRLRAVLAALASHDSVDASVMAEVSPDWRAALRNLENRGWVERYCAREATPATSGGPGQIEPLPDPSPAQRVAIEAIVRELGTPQNFLLHGVTGSGKTEVYLQAISAVVARGEQALVLVPEIALTPQLVRRFAARFAEPVAVLHSALPESERLAAWRAAREGRAPIVIGTRSAVFTPLARPGILIVDEEHDASFKQQEGFRYSARDLAIARAQRQRVPIVLGSATPSLETLARIHKGKAVRLALPQRAGSARPPQVALIDLRRHGADQGLSTPVMLAMRRHLDTGGQVLLYLNRRGYAPVLYCPQCGWAAACQRCDARMTVHRREERLTCHHCGLETAVPSHCPQCAAETRPVGQGTERIEETVARLYPDAPLVRIDRDVVRRRDELEDVLAQADSGSARILIGTQMLTKGHHFPGVTLVVVLNADQGLFSTDFRASERLAQTIVQVAGRAGRAERPGEVLIQTAYPEHPLLTCLLAGGYDAFADAALAERAAAGWPPTTRLALFRAEAHRTDSALDFLGAVRDVCAAQAARDVELLGPAPAPMQRRAGRYRAQLLVRSATPAPLQRVLRRVLPVIEQWPSSRRLRWSIDVDPLELF